MFYLETQLLQIEGITEVLEHKQTDGTASSQLLQPLNKTLNCLKAI